MSRVFGAGDYQYEVVENWGRSGERPKLGLVSSSPSTHRTTFTYSNVAPRR